MFDLAGAARCVRLIRHDFVRGMRGWAVGLGVNCFLVSVSGTKVLFTHRRASVVELAKLVLITRRRYQSAVF